MSPRANDGDPAQARNLRNLKRLQACRMRKKTAAFWIAPKAAGAAAKNGFGAVERDSFRDNRGT